MNGYIDPKHVGHNLEEEIKEFEEMTQVFAIVNEFDEEENTLFSRVSFLPLKLLFRDISFLISISVMIFGWIVTLQISDNIEEFGTFAQLFRTMKSSAFYFIFINLLIVIAIHIAIRFIFTKRLNEIGINFNSKKLTVKNIDFIGRYMYQDRVFDFNEIKQFRIRLVIRIWSIFGWKNFHIISLETKDGATYPLNILRLKKWHKINYKRLISLFNSILKL